MGTEYTLIQTAISTREKASLRTFGLNVKYAFGKEFRGMTAMPVGLIWDRARLSRIDAYSQDIANESND